MRQVPQGTRTFIAQTLERGAGIVGRNSACPLAARLALHRMGLVDHPVPNGGQYFSLGRHVAEQQRVIGHHDVRTRGSAAGAVDQALVGIKRAEATGALTRRGGKVRPVDAPPTNTQAVEVSRGRLAHVGVDYRHGGQGVRGIFRGCDLLHAAAHALKLAQAGIMIVTLKGTEAQLTVVLLGKLWQLMINKLVSKVVRLGGDTDGHLVASRGLGCRKQVRYRFAYPRAGLYDAVGTTGDRLANLTGHLDLLGARLEPVVHRRDLTARHKLHLEFILGRHAHERKLVGIYVFAARVMCQHVCAGRNERKGRARVLPRKKREYRAVSPADVRMHIGQAAMKTARQIREGRQQDAPYATQGINVVASAVRHGSAPKQLGHVGELVGYQTRQRDARQGQRVDPDVAHAHAALYRLDKGTVERRVVGDNGAAPHKLLEGGHGFLSRRGLHHVCIGNAGQLCDFGRNGHTGVHKRVEAVDDFASTKAGRRDLDQAVVLQRQPGGLGVEDDDIVFNQAKRPRLRPLGKRRVRLDYTGRGARQHGFVNLHEYCCSSSLFGGSLERHLDQARTDVAKGHVCVDNLVWIQRGGRHAGNGIGLKDDRALVGHDKIAARNAKAPQRPMGATGELLRRAVIIIGDARGNTMNLCGVHVLDAQVIELRGLRAADLHDREGLQVVIIAQHAHRDLGAHNALLDKDLVRILKGEIDGARKLRRIFYQRDSVA